MLFDKVKKFVEKDCSDGDGKKICYFNEIKQVVFDVVKDGVMVKEVQRVMGVFYLMIILWMLGVWKRKCVIVVK